MRALSLGKKGTLTLCGVVLLALAASGCFVEPPAPSKPAVEPPDWLSVETTAERPDVLVERVAYRSGDLTIQGQVCRPRASGRHPLLIFNHGGFDGVPDWNDPDGPCAAFARTGWVVAESSYRGQDGSDGRLEMCLGEVDDVLAMLEVLRAQAYVDARRIAMVGLSHGGCITSRAVERGADVDVAVDIAGPTNWASLVNSRDRAARSLDPATRALRQRIMATVVKAIGGSPEQYPERYAARSPDSRKIARWNRPFLIMHGSADTIVPVHQSCAMAVEIGGFEAYRLDAYGGSGGRLPDGCAALAPHASPGRVRSFEADRQLWIYDGVDHLLVANNGLGRMTPDLIGFIEAKMG